MEPVPTAAVADACVRLRVPVRAAPAGLAPVRAGSRAAGPVRAVVHAGSVDALLEAIHEASPGDVLLVENGGRDDEACVGDLVALEAEHRGLAAILVHGLHRDTETLRMLDIPLWSRGAIPPGPAGPREERRSPRLGIVSVTRDDVAFADDDGVVLVDAEDVAAVVETALAIVETERAQADRVRKGVPLWEQLGMDVYVAARHRGKIDFRTHLRRLGRAIEE